MSTYEMGAFDALEWAWHMLRNKDSVNDATVSIQDALYEMGKGVKVDFQEKTQKVN
jgi:hypothetical protein